MKPIYRQGDGGLASSVKLGTLLRKTATSVLQQPGGQGERYVRRQGERAKAEEHGKFGWHYL